MFTIRKEQMEALARARVADFMDRMVEHLSPSSLPEGELRALIWNGIQRAAGEGIVSERDVCAYIEALIREGGAGNG